MLSHLKHKPRSVGSAYSLQTSHQKLSIKLISVNIKLNTNIYKNLQSASANKSRKYQQFIGTTNILYLVLTIKYIYLTLYLSTLSDNIICERR